MTLEFQIYDYSEDHEISNNDSDEEHKGLGNYIIHTFGRTMDNKSVYAKITGFTPYFYIALPDKWIKNSKSELKEKIEILRTWLLSRDNKKIWSKYKDTLLSMEYIKKKKPDGFSYDIQTGEERKYNFARLVFNNSEGMEKFSYF